MLKKNNQLQINDYSKNSRWSGHSMARLKRGNKINPIKSLECKGKKKFIKHVKMYLPVYNLVLLSLLLFIGVVAL
tara:strand:+ start:17 stop:241 length:225 start_codon:yes stop_codon:yes gene_type:complete